ncbi:hypothetical protein JCM14076_14780 [Methylosoma difficile]
MARESHVYPGLYLKDKYFFRNARRWFELIKLCHITQLTVLYHALENYTFNINGLWLAWFYGCVLSHKLYLIKR